MPHTTTTTTPCRYQKLRKAAGLVLSDKVDMFYDPAAGTDVAALEAVLAGHVSTAWL